MVEIELKSNELKEDVYLNLNKNRNTPIYDEDLDKIKHLKLNALDFLDEPTDVTLFDLVFFKNLKSCCIINKEISSKELEVLNSMQCIDTLQLTNCLLPKDGKLKLNLEYLILDKCANVNISSYNNMSSLKRLRIVNCPIVNINGISRLENLTDLYLQNLNIDNIDEVGNLKKLEYLNLNGTNISTLNLEKNSKLKIVHEEMNFLYDEEE